MQKVRVHNIAVSTDGYAAGPSQSMDAPMGLGGDRLHEWAFETRWGHAMLGQDGGAEGLDNDFLLLGEEGIGATIIGRNMFGPIRGAWDPSDDWRGWWGDEPPYHHSVFVLTHHEHEPMTMQGGTTFHFVTGGIEAALEGALSAAGGADVRIGGGASTIQQFLAAGLVDEMHVVVVPVLLGGGERLFDNLEGASHDGKVEFIPSPPVLHVRYSPGA